MDADFLASVLNNMIALILSLSVHEAAHALVAKMQGDPTAAMDGRLTLNPIPHIDPVGTLVFPLIGGLMGASIFGWAKPVPIDTRYFKHKKWGPVFVAAAGPTANLILCVLAVMALGLYDTHFTQLIPKGHIFYAFVKLAISMVWINAILAVFNLLPLSPLDGGTVFQAFLPYNLRNLYETYVTPYGMFILLALMFTGGLQWLGTVAGVWIGIAQSITVMIFK